MCRGSVLVGGMGRVCGGIWLFRRSETCNRTCRRYNLRQTSWVIPSNREIATPRGLVHRARLGARNDPPILYMIFVVKSNCPCALPPQPQKLASPLFWWRTLLKKRGELPHYLLQFFFDSLGVFCCDALSRQSSSLPCTHKSVTQCPLMGVLWLGAKMKKCECGFRGC